MFDTMTITKAGGALCGALLIFLLGKWAAEELYHTETPEVAGFAIEVEASDAVVEEVEEIDVAAILALGDPAAGARAYSKCRACHQLEDGANGTGPHLYAVIGRAVDAVDGFNYSGALSAVVDVWTPEAMFEFLENPRAYAPGNRMSFAGIRRTDERADLIAYLATIGE